MNLSLTYRTANHPRYLSYSRRRMICFLSLITTLVSLGFLVCIDLKLFPFITDSINAYRAARNINTDFVEASFVEKYIRVIFIYGIIACCILAFRIMLEKMRESIFTAIIGAFATALVSIQIFSPTILFFTENYPLFWQRYLLIISYISFGFFWFYYWGYYPLSARILMDAMYRTLEYKKRIIGDWVKEGTSDYPLCVFPLEQVIPQDVSQLVQKMHNMDPLPLDRMFRQFYYKKPATKKGLEALILIGGFGSGKSTAMANSVQKRLRDFKHYGEIPVYVKLRDWLNSDALEKDKDHNIYKSETDYYMDLLCKLVVGNMDEESFKGMKKSLIGLHESRRLIYVFDGINELLQQSTDASGEPEEQKARDLCAFLYRFCRGNRCIMSMCEIPGVLTTRSVLIDSKFNNYLIYALDGVHIQQRSEKNWTHIYRHSVALYRLAQNDYEQGEHNPQTIFDLLEQYVKDQISNELIDTVKINSCQETLLQLMEIRIQNDSNYFINPYSSFYDDSANTSSDSKEQQALDALTNSGIFYRAEINKSENNETKQTIQYHFCHILIFEYVLARYLYNKVLESKDQKKDIIDIIKKAFIGSSKGKNNIPNILEHSHLIAVFSMILTQCNDQLKEKIIEPLLTPYSNNNSILIRLLVMLSHINDDIKAIIENQKNLSCDTTDREIIKILDNPKIKISRSQKVALLRLLTTTKKPKYIDKILSSPDINSWKSLNITRNLLLEKAGYCSNQEPE